MSINDSQKIWEEYVHEELLLMTPILGRLGYRLYKEQPHIGGERYLIQAVTTVSGRKLILIGERNSDQKKVVIKISDSEGGIEEIKHERECRRALSKLTFAYGVFHSPKEILFTKSKGRVISIQEFLESSMSFLDRPTKEQFSLALSAFKTQESAHATTFSHRRFAKHTFGVREPKEYLHAFDEYHNVIKEHFRKRQILLDVLRETRTYLYQGYENIKRYSGFLTHTDFVPHNFKIIDSNIYLLDHSALRFGNKHEGWARFINFMELYNPELVDACIQYFKNNRAQEELQSLTLMRLYRLGEILYYYTNTLENSSGSLLALNTERIALWEHVLTSVLSGNKAKKEILQKYRETRELLRSDAEKKRQIGLH